MVRECNLLTFDFLGLNRRKVTVSFDGDRTGHCSIVWPYPPTFGPTKFGHWPGDKCMYTQDSREYSYDTPGRSSGRR